MNDFNFQTQESQVKEAGEMMATVPSYCMKTQSFLR